MKTLFIVSIVPLISPLAFGQATLPAVIERGPHHRVWERTVTETLPNGATAERKSAYTELATGIHYWKDGQWAESKDEIEIFQGAAVARQGQHSVIFAAQLNSPGAIDLLAPDDKRFRSHILGLAYTDSASGRSVMIAETKDCTGAVLPPNQVIYQDGFSGDCVADVRFTYTKAGFEQDIILLTAPPSPAQWNMNPETTRLEVWTEFIELPEGTATPVVLKQETDPVLRQQMAEPDLIDQRLDFGVMKCEQGQAFPLGDADPFGGAAVPTGKSIERIDGRVFLIEKVDYRDIREQLQALPQQAVVKPPRKINDPVNGRRMFAGMLPLAPKGAKGVWRANQVAKLDTNRKGFVLDYILTSTTTNFTFKGDTTYYVASDVQLSGTTTLEGGAVIKLTNSTFAARVWIKGPLQCLTTSYRPAFFTARDDGTVGEPLPGAASLPNTNMYYGSRMLDFGSNTNLIDLHDVHFRYGERCLALSGANVTLSHAQIGQSALAFYQTSASLALRNVLLHDVSIAFGNVSTNRVEQATFHRIGTFSSTGVITNFLTNCVLISVTNATYIGANNVINLNDSGIFQTVGAGSHYLAAGSTNRNAGTTNIGSTLLADLKKRTTYPPIVIGGGTLFTNSLVLYPQAQRDTDIPDLGFSYSPLDYVFSGLALTNATITVMPGVAIGTRTLNSYGLGLLGGAQFICEGTPDNLNRIVRYNTVQEQANTNWIEYASYGGSIITAWTPASTAPHARLRFTEFSVPAGNSLYHFSGYSEDAGTHDFRDCQFNGGVVYSPRPTIGVTNCLFNRTQIALEELEHDMNPIFRHCTFAGSDLNLSHAGSGTWTFQNNLFDGTTNSYTEGSFTNNYNAYTTNAMRLTPNGANDKLLSVTNIAYDTGWLGRFYLPTNLTSHSTLFNNGSAAANTLGFYHYTAVTNQTRELTSVIDFGFHYVTVNSTGQLLDSDGDGLPDYFEDTNGDGSFNGIETNWDGYNSLNGLTGTPGLQVFTPLK